MAEDDDEDDKPKKPAGILDSRKVFQAVVTAIATAAALGIGSLLLNGITQGGLIHLLGGLTKDDIADLAKEKKAQESSQSSPNDLLPAGAIIAFDIPCPFGWVLADETIGSAIVGAGSWITGEPGSPAPNDGRTDTTALRFDPTKGVMGKPAYFVSHSPIGVPISRYVFGVRSTFTPNYLPLWYCKKILAPPLSPPFGTSPSRQ